MTSQELANKLDQSISRTQAMKQLPVHVITVTENGYSAATIYSQEGVAYWEANVETNGFRHCHFYNYFADRATADDVAKGLTEG